MAKLPRKAASRAATDDQRLSADAGLGLPRGVDDQGGRRPRVFLRRDRPRLAKSLPRSIGNCVNLGRLQRVGSDRQSPSKRVEKYAQRLLPLIRGGAAKYYRTGLKGRVVGRKLVEPDIMRADEAQLLRARVGKAPTAPLVGPDAMRDHARQCAFGVDQAGTLRLRIQHPFLAANLVGRGKA
jgi:hypothetical protein